MRTSYGRALRGGLPRGWAFNEGASDPLAAMLPAGNPRYLRGEWSACDLEQIGAVDRVLVLGAGRAAFDAVLALDRQGHRGTVCVVSPRGSWFSASNRLAPAAAERLAAMRAAGRLEAYAGQVRDVAAYGDTFVVDVLPRGRTLHSSERYDWILNCTAAAEAAAGAPPVALRP